MKERPLKVDVGALEGEPAVAHAYLVKLNVLQSRLIVLHQTLPLSRSMKSARKNTSKGQMS